MRPLREFWTEHPDVERPLRAWATVVERALWTNFAEVKTHFNSADRFQCCTIFDIGGNKYRLITHIDFRYHRIDIRFVLTHKEYDRDDWKTDC